MTYAYQVPLSNDPASVKRAYETLREINKPFEVKHIDGQNHFLTDDDLSGVMAKLNS
jgi:hypothetical protein